MPESSSSLEDVLSSISSSVPASSSESASTEGSESVECVVGAVSLTLTPLFQKNFMINDTSGFRLRVVASDACGFYDGKIFRHYQYPEDLLTDSSIREFTGVCTWPDLESYPADEPNETDCPRVFRLDYFDIVVATESLANEVWELVKEEVDALQRTVVEGQTLEAADPFEVGP